MNFSFLINNTLSADIGIDLGSGTTAIFIPKKGIVLKEPSYIACDTKTGEVQAVGEEAYQMLGKNPPSVNIIRPIVNGVVSDFEMTCKMLKAFISKIYKKTILKPRVLASIPSDSTQIEQRAAADALREAGAREVYLIEEPLAAAAGAGCDISLARGLLIAHIGSGRCDVASISLGHSVIKKSITAAGDAFTEEIIKCVRKNHNLVIGTLTAESIKHEIGCAYPKDKIETVNISGCDASTGLPRFVTVNSEEIREYFIPLLQKISEVIKNTLEDTPCELQSDISEDGILITGGGGTLWGLDKYLRMELGMKVFVIDSMDECVINGIGAELSKLDIPNPQGGRYYYAVQ